jgi:hypothetical protein
MNSAVDLLRQHRRDLETMVAENRALMRGDCSKVDRVILEGLNRQAGRYLAAIRSELAHGVQDGPYGTLGRFGRNQHGPAIADIISNSEIQRRLAKSAAADRRCLEALDDLAPRREAVGEAIRNMGRAAA